MCMCGGGCICVNVCVCVYVFYVVYVCVSVCVYVLVCVRVSVEIKGHTNSNSKLFYFLPFLKNPFKLIIFPIWGKNYFLYAGKS